MDEEKKPLTLEQVLRQHGADVTATPRGLRVDWTPEEQRRARLREAAQRVIAEHKVKPKRKKN